MRYLKYSALFLVGVVFISVLIICSYFFGYTKGLRHTGADIAFFNFKLPYVSVFQDNKGPEPTPVVIVKNPKVSPPTWGGPELWEAVNKKRQENGVNPLDSKAEICTIAAIRLNELLSLGSLDGHEGFSNMPENRPDLRPIFEKYNLTEFLVSGAQDPAEAVSSWENTLGHKKLLTGGEYVWGCIYAQSGFAVAITAY